MSEEYDTECFECCGYQDHIEMLEQTLERATVMSENKQYIVGLRLNISGYEKYSVMGVRAKDETEAGTLALEGECHNDPYWGDDESKQSVWDDTMRYFVEWVKEVEDPAEWSRICAYIAHL